MKYLVKSNYKDIIINLLKKRKYFKDNKIINFVYVDHEHAWKKNLNKLPKYNIINVLNSNKNVITWKDSLYTNMKNNYPDIYNKYFPDQITINTNNIKNKIIKDFMLKNKSCILKPVMGFGGKDITYYNDYNILISYLLKNKNKTYVLAKLINNPKLYKKKKFHLRVLFIHTIINNKHYSYVYKITKLAAAKKDYNINILSSDVIDTHFNSSPYKDVYMDISKYKTQIIELFKPIHNLLEHNKVKSYNNNDGYEILGADIIITDDNMIQLLEINDRIGYKYNNKYMINLLNNIFDITIDKIFNKDTKINNNFIYIMDYKIVKKINTEKFIDISNVYDKLNKKYKLKFKKYFTIFYGYYNYIFTHDSESNNILNTDEYKEKTNKILKYNFTVDWFSAYYIIMFQDIKYNFNNKKIYFIIKEPFIIESLIYYMKKNKILTDLNILRIKYKHKDYSNKLDNIIDINNINIIKKLDKGDFYLIGTRTYTKNTNNYNINLLNQVKDILQLIKKKGTIIVVSRGIIHKYIYNIYKYIGTFFKDFKINFLYLNKYDYLYIHYNEFKGINNKELKILNELLLEKNFVEFINNDDLDNYINNKIKYTQSRVNNLNIIENIIVNKNKKLLYEFHKLHFIENLNIYKQNNLEIVDWLNNTIPSSYFTEKINNLYYDIKSTIILLNLNKINIKESNKILLNSNILNKLIDYDNNIYQYDIKEQINMINIITKKENDIYKLLKKKYKINTNIEWCSLYELYKETDFFNTKKQKIFFISQNTNEAINSTLYYLNNKCDYIAQKIINNTFSSNINLKKYDFGELNNGDISDINNIIYYKKKYPNINYIVSTSNNNHIIYELLFSLYLLNKGGNMVFKINHINIDNYYISLILFIIKVFDNVNIFSPSINIWEPSIYLVAKGYMGTKIDMLNIIKNYKEDNPIYLVSDISENILHEYINIFKKIIDKYTINIKFIYFLNSNPEISKLFNKNIDKYVDNFIKKWINKYFIK